MMYVPVRIDTEYCQLPKELVRFRSKQTIVHSVYQINGITDVTYVLNDLAIVLLSLQLPVSVA